MANRVKRNGKAEKPIKRLRAECARLRAELASVTRERDNYLKSLHAIFRNDGERYNQPFTDEELASMVEMDITDLKCELRLLEKNRSCRKTRASNSKSVGRRRIVKA